MPMTLRDPFLEDPFFPNTLSSLESSRSDCFKKVRDEFEESRRQMEQTMTGIMSHTTRQDRLTLVGLGQVGSGALGGLSLTCLIRLCLTDWDGSGPTGWVWSGPTRQVGSGQLL